MDGLEIKFKNGEKTIVKIGAHELKKEVVAQVCKLNKVPQKSVVSTKIIKNAFLS